MAQDAAWVPVLPQMKDFGSVLTKNVTSASKQAGTQAGLALSKAMDAATDTSAAQKMVDDLKKASQQAQRTVQQETANIARARAGESDAAAKVTLAEQKLADARTKHGSQSAEATAAEQKLSAARDRQQAAAIRVTGAEDQLRAAKTQQKTVNGQLSDAEKTLAKETEGAGKKASDSGGLWSRLKEKLGGARGEAVETGGAMSTLKDKVSGVGQALGIAAAAAAGFQFVKSFVGPAIEASDAMDKFKQTLNFAGLDTNTIDKLSASTQKYADETVYDLSDIQSVTSQLAANAVPNYDKLAEAAGNLNAVAGGNVDTYKSVGMVLTQTAGAGKLTTENWNQLANAIPGASGKLQDALLKAGAYTGNFRDAMADGQITADEFNQAIMGLGMTDVAEQAATSTSTMEGAWGNFQATMTGGIKGIVDQVKPSITGALSWASDKMDAFFGWAGGALQGLSDLIGKGDFSEAFRKAFNVEEDSTAVDVILKIRDGAIGLYDLLVKGDFSGHLRDAFNVEEDNPIVGFLLDARQAVIDFATSIPERIGSAWKWIQDNSEWITPIIVGIGGAAAAFKIWTGAITLWQNVTKIATGVQTAFNLVMDANPVMLVVMAVTALAAGLTYFFTQTETGQAVLQWFSDTFHSFVDWIGPAWSGLWNGAGELWSNFWHGAVDGWNSFWAMIGNGLTSFGQTITTGWNALWNGIGKLWSDFWHGVVDGWNEFWSNVWGLAKQGGTWVKDTILGAFTNLKDSGIDLFHKLADGIGDAWSKLKAKAAEPVNFVIETVYNGGLKKLADTVFEKLGMDTRLPSVNKIAFAGGGVMPGYTPGVDVHHFWSPTAGRLDLSGGEAIMRPEFTRAVGGPAGVAALNARAIRGQAFADGGVWGGITGALSSVGGFFRDKWEGLANFVGNIAGNVRALITAPVENLLGSIAPGMFGDLGRGVIKSALSNLTGFFTRETKDLQIGNGGLVGAAMRAVTMGIPYVWGGSTSAGLDCSGLVYWAAQQLGLGWPRLTAAGYQSASRGIPAGQAGPGTLLFWGNPAYHVAIAAGNGMMVEEPRPGLNARYTTIYGGPSAGIYSGGASSGTYAALAEKAFSGAATVGQARDRLYASLYDQGGVLHPGVTNVLNASQKPEAVLTNAQWANLEKIANQSGAAGWPERMEADLYLDDGTRLDGYIRVRARDEVDQVTGKAKRGSVRERRGGR